MGLSPGNQCRTTESSAVGHLPIQSRDLSHGRGPWHTSTSLMWGAGRLASLVPAVRAGRSRHCSRGTVQGSPVTVGRLLAGPAGEPVCSSRASQRGVTGEPGAPAKQFQSCPSTAAFLSQWKHPGGFCRYSLSHSEDHATVAQLRTLRTQLPFGEQWGKDIIYQL
ncbi:UNVERIFIED_CONTAM: hypothetical protein K2H54_048376 [Gekko kuhli]